MRLARARESARLAKRLGRRVARNVRSINQFKDLASYAIFWYDFLIRNLRIHSLPLRGRSCSIELIRYGSVNLRLGLADGFLLEEIFLRGIYDFIDVHIKDCRFILDLGANVGYTMFLFAQKWPNASMLGVEPESENFAALVKQVSNLDAAVAKGFVGSDHSDRVLDLESTECAYRLVPRLQATGNTQETQWLSIEELIGSREVIDLVKCDIEGSERELFRSCSTWIRRVKYILVELHYGYSVGELMRDLEDQGGDFSLVNTSPIDSNIYLLESVRDLT